MDFNQLRKSSSGVEFLNLDGACEAEETILREMLFSQQDDEQLSNLFQLKPYSYQSYREQLEVEAIQAATESQLMVNTTEMEGVVEHMGVHEGTPVAISANGPMFMSPQNHEMNPAMMPGMQAMRGYYSQQPISVVHGGNGTNVGQPHGVVNQQYPHVSVGIPGGQQQYLMMQANTGQYVNLPPMHYVHAHRHGGHTGNFVQGPSSGKYVNGPRKSHPRSSERRGRQEQDMVFTAPQFYPHQQNIYTANVAYYNQHLAPTLTGSPIIMAQKQLPMYAYGGAPSYGPLVHAPPTSEQPSELQVNGEESAGAEELEIVSAGLSETTELSTSMENVTIGQEQHCFTTENGEVNVSRTSVMQSVSSTNVVADEKKLEPGSVPDNSNIKCPSGNNTNVDQVESIVDGANTAKPATTSSVSNTLTHSSASVSNDTAKANGTSLRVEATPKVSGSVEKTDFPALDSSASAVAANGDNRTSTTAAVKSWASICRRPNQGHSGAPASASSVVNTDSPGSSQALPSQLGFHNGSSDPSQRNVLQSISTSAPNESEEVQLANLISNVHEFDGNSLNDSTDPQAIRLGEFLVNYQLDHHATALTPRGLTNQSNFCYINATLQALMACPPFVNLFRSMRDIGLGKNPCRATPIIQSVFDFVAEFEPLARGTANKRERRNETCVTGSNLEPTGIRKVLGLLDGSTYKIEGRQQDAEEFLSHLLNGLHDEMIKVMEWYHKSKVTPSSQPVEIQNGSPGDTEEYPDDDDPDHWQVMGPKNKGCLTRKTNISKSPISEMLFGQLCSALHRANSVKSATLQPFFTLPLDIQLLMTFIVLQEWKSKDDRELAVVGFHHTVISDNVKSLRDALEGLTSKEEVTGLLTQSGHETEAWRQLSLEELPMILILHLKRFVYDKSGQKINKVDKILEFGVDLEIAKDLLSTNVRGKCSPKQRQYKLFAVVYHDGEEAYKGHYVADCFHPSGGSSWGSVGWLRYDDVSVKPVVESAMLNSQPPRVPYLLYYRRVDTLSQSPTQPARKDR